MQAGKICFKRLYGPSLSFKYKKIELLLWAFQKTLFVEVL
jgi:hypothetical protein